jgi:hypothetical protein
LHPTGAFFAENKVSEDLRLLEKVLKAVFLFDPTTDSFLLLCDGQLLCELTLLPIYGLKLLTLFKGLFFGLKSKIFDGILREHHEIVIVCIVPAS